MQLNTPLSSEYGQALGRGVVLIVLVLEIAALVLDGGLTTQITLMAVLAYLGGVAGMVVDRPQAPTATDLWMLRWGFLPLWCITQVSARLVWSWRGLL